MAKPGTAHYAGPWRTVVVRAVFSSMDFDFDDTAQAFRATLRRYADTRLRPDYARWDRGERLPRERVRELGELGVLGLRVAADYGGSEASYVLAGIAAEELGRGDFNFTLLLQLALIAAELVGGHGTPELRAALLPGLASGERLIAFGLTETGAGSDAAAIRSRAMRDGETYVIDGEKASITLAGSADDCIVFARIDGVPGAQGIGAFAVPLTAAGVTREAYRSVGEKLTERGALRFEGVRVPATHRLGAGSGFVQAMEAFDYNRAIIALACVGAAQQSLDETVEYTKQRHTFGKPLALREGVAFQIAEHATRLAAARHLAYHALWLRDCGRPHTKEAAMAKWLGPKSALDAIHACLVLHGWPGYDETLPYAQRLRDVLGLEIGDGTPEIMKGVIAREIYGREFTSFR